MGRGGGEGTNVPSLKFEPINGNIDQSIASFFGVTEPVNGSWMQAICESFGITTCENGSWLYTFVKYNFEKSEYYPIYLLDEFGDPVIDPETDEFIIIGYNEFEVINGCLWQSFFYYMDLDASGVSGEGNWKNITFQLMSFIFTSK